MKNKISSDFTLNLDTLKMCREQLSLTIEDVLKKVPNYRNIESGKKRPTYRQLDVLSSLYHVPRWIFTVEEMPNEYKFFSTQTYKEFKNNSTFGTPEIKKLIKKVLMYRDFIIELKHDHGDPIPKFNYDMDISVENIQKKFNVSTHVDFIALRDKIEQENVFIFLADHSDLGTQKDSFYGATISYKILPIIILNDSHKRGRQSFNLMRQIFHLYKREMSLDTCYTATIDFKEECDSFALDFLISSDRLYSDIASFGDNWKSINNFKIIAKKFRVSIATLLLKFAQIGVISNFQYYAYLDLVFDPIKNRKREINRRYGSLFIDAVLASYHRNDISYMGVMRLFDVKDRFSLKKILNSNY